MSLTQKGILYPLNPKTKPIVLYLILLLGCRDSPLNKDTTTIKYFEDGHIESIYIKGSSKGNISSFRFNKNGVLEFYSNKNADSVYNELLFFPNGNIEQKLTYHEGKMNGTAVTFFKSGNIETIRYQVKGKDTISGLNYYDTSFLRASAAVYFNRKGEIFYKEYFDFDGNIIKTEGKKD